MKYILEYPIPISNNEGRYYALSACEKAKYIYSVLNRLGHKVEIISASYAKRCVHSRIDSINESTVLISGASLGWNNRFTKLVSRLSSMIWLLCFLLVRCKKGETILIYHGVQNIPIYIFAKWIKKFTYILEVEEIYSMLGVSTFFNWRHRLEKLMIRYSDRYVFASKQLESSCNIRQKPYVICTGAYIVPPRISSPLNDGKIHVVYAGLIASGKVAFKSAQIGLYLNNDYHLHIIGYGCDNDINQLKDFINSINKQTMCHITYDGLKEGDEYVSFLQSCHIGLCPLTTSLHFQRACFPSKITSYLSNGLLVLTTKNEVLETSVYSDYLYFVNNDTPKEFADMILNINTNMVNNPRQCIISEDERVINEFTSILK